MLQFRVVQEFQVFDIGYDDPCHASIGGSMAHKAQEVFQFITRKVVKFAGRFSKQSLSSVLEDDYPDGRPLLGFTVDCDADVFCAGSPAVVNSSINNLQNLTFPKL